MSLAQALGIAAAAFLTFVDPQGCLVSSALAETPDRVRAVVQQTVDVIGDSIDLHFELSHADGAPVPDARIHSRVAPL